MLHIDGSQGEGGGQILRSSLALSMALGRPFTISNIRANRPKPGLMRQHMTAVQAAAAICSARVAGAVAGSRELIFEPGDVRGGTYHFSVGTAGSTTLVLQAVLPALLFAREPSELVIEGGTHARWAPPFEFLANGLVPILNRLGADIRVELQRYGFYPAGGGRIRVRVTPTESPRSVRLDSPGMIMARRVRVLLARLPVDIADRELQRIRERLGWEVDRSCIVYPTEAVSPGNVVTLEAESEHVIQVFCSIGEHGKSAESVADEAIDQVRDYLAAGVAVASCLADQLMVPFAIASAKGGEVYSFRTLALTRHAATNAVVVAAFLPGLAHVESEGSAVRWVVARHST